MLLERSKTFNNEVFRRSINLDKDNKYTEKEDRLLARNLDIISKDARRVSRTMGAEQRNLIRRSTSVQVMTGDASFSNKMRPDTPVMPHAILYGSANTFNSCSNTRYSYHGQDPRNSVSYHSGTSRYSDNMMNDIRSIANKALTDLDKTKGPGKERSGESWGLIKRESMRERRNSKADNLLQQNISKWHTSFQRSSATNVNDSSNLVSKVRTRKTGHTAEMNRSYSCDLPRIDSRASYSRSSLGSRKSEPAIALQKYGVYLPNIG